MLSHVNSELSQGDFPHSHRRMHAVPPHLTLSSDMFMCVKNACVNVCVDAGLRMRGPCKPLSTDKRDTACFCISIYIYIYILSIFSGSGSGGGQTLISGGQDLGVLLLALHMAFLLPSLPLTSCFPLSHNPRKIYSTLAPPSGRWLPNKVKLAKVIFHFRRTF